MRKKKFSPVFVFIILTFLTLILSMILNLFNVQAEYSTVNTYTNTIQNNVIQVENLLSIEGIKYIVSSTVSNFVNFEVLGVLVISLIGIGALERSGFAKSFFTLITQNSRKNNITFIIVLLSIISSLFGNTGFIIILPLSALLFYYGHRNPLGGIIASFAGSSFGYLISIFLNSTDTSLLNITLNASHVIDSSYNIGIYFELFIMIIATIASALLITKITEKKIMPTLGRYEFKEIETLEKTKLSNRELRGLILSITAALIYLLIIIYMIIPGLPLSGVLLDDSQVYYIDKLFGESSLFSQGFVFIVTFLFILIGLVYGYIAKTIRHTKEVSECFSYSLDNIGNIIVLIFVASLFISVYEKSNIGLVLVAFLTNIIGSLNFSGIGQILILFVISIIASIIYPPFKTKWNMMAATVVPSLMNTSISPEMTQVVFASGSSLGLALTPLLIYYVVYIAFLEKYDQNKEITVSLSFKYMSTYFIALLVMWVILILGFYLTGLPIGIGSNPILNF